MKASQIIVSIIAVLALCLGVAAWRHGSVEGPRGPQGAQGAQGIAGVPGKDGRNGIDGRNGRDGRDATPILGAASPEFGPYITIGGVRHNGARISTLNQASTTVCSIQSPSATSTLVFGSFNLRTGTTTALFVDLGRSNFFDSTTTVINSTVVPSGALVTINATSTQSGTLIFAPNQFFNVKYGGSALGSLNVLVGDCMAEWIID